MRKTIHLASLAGAALIMLVASPAPAAAQDLSGSWTLVTEGPRGPQTMSLALRQEGSTLTGTLSVIGRGGEAIEVELEDGSVNEGAFSFTTTMRMGPNEVPQAFSGRLDGDQLKGTIGGPRGERPFTGQRAGPAG